MPFPDAAVEASIPERFERQAELYPDRIAVKSRRRQWTYRQLNEQANRIGRTVLAWCGDGNEPVALLMDKDGLHFAAILGVLKAGKIYVPLSPSAPAARNALIFEQSKATLLLTDRATQRAAADLVPKDVAIVNAEAAGFMVDDSNLGLNISPSSYANIIFTSGSTGQPKGVVLSHRTLLHNVQNYTNDVGISFRDRMICVGPCAFSGILKGVFGALLNGAALLPIEVQQTGLDGVADLLRRERITIYDSVPSLFRALTETLPEGERFPDLRVVRLGGEAMTARDVELFQRRFSSPCVLVNGWGPTEVGTVTLWLMKAGDAVEGEAVPIGRECRDMEVLLLDEAGQEVGLNCAAQMGVRSSFLSAGYWQRPDLTEEAFLPDPEGGERRIYLTGDYAFRRPDGCLMFAGRRDDQVKIRGYRIEIAEIEAALHRHAQVRAAAVKVGADHRGDARLLAYVVPRNPKHPPATADLIAFLKARLPDYAVPATFMVLETLPLNANGKVDRHALPAPIEEPRQTLVAPRNDVEDRLLGIWKGVLKVADLGVTDDFFALGGNSLSAAILMAEIHKVFGKALPLSAFRKDATVTRLARVIAGADVVSWPALVPLQPSGTRPAFFCVHGVGGEVLCLEKLAQCMGSDQPFYAFQSKGLSSGEEPLERIEDMAAHYLADLLRFQPEGPYFIGGYSLGGAVAYEMAQQLTRAGHEVCMLAIIDHRNIHRRPAGRMSAAAVGRCLCNVPRWLIDEVRQGSRRQLLRRLCRKLARLEGRLRGFLGLGIPERTKATVADVLDVSRFPERHRRILELNFRACRNYVAEPYAGRIALLRARTQPLFRLQRVDMGWKDFARAGVEIHYIRGNHSSILAEPNVRSLAHELRASIDRSVPARRPCRRVLARSAS
jgi:amino acid adenylation domain-containing protein